jgi:hypothetical protein
MAMLNLNYVGCIASQLGWTMDEVIQAINELDNSFMCPDIEYLNESEAREYLDDPEASEGLYARLAAPGYLDCTDWLGPFENEWRAYAELLETYSNE